MQTSCWQIPVTPQMRKFHRLFRGGLILNPTKSKFESSCSFLPIAYSRKNPPLHHLHLLELRTIHSTSNRSQEPEVNADIDHPGAFLSSDSSSDSWKDEFSSAHGHSSKPSGDVGSSNGEVSPRSLSASGFRKQNFSPQTPTRGITKPEHEGPRYRVQNRKAESSALSTGPEARSQWSTLTKKMAKSKSKIHWVCDNCGASYGQWLGFCRHCGEMNTLKQFAEAEKLESKTRGADVSEKLVRSWFTQNPVDLRPQSLSEVYQGMTQTQWRTPLVLGGGLVPGSLILVGGDPGVGKSTLLLQIAAMLAETSKTRVIYISAEESVEQIGHRADRMRIGTDDLFLYSSTDIEDILEKIHVLSPQAVIVDSIQTVYLRGVPGSAGSITQVRECTSALLRFAKESKIPVLLIGHVTKSGDIAGPRVLEHIVDTVLYMEGERYSAHRLLRSVKNRFGSTDELGVFEMSERGLQVVSNPSEIFLSENNYCSEVLAGLAVTVIIDGSRTFVIEIQALCSSGSMVARQVNGVPANRADMIISVLMKQAGLKLQDNAIFLNVVSGIKLTETAADLAVAAAICSSFLEFPLPNNVAFIGEIGLGGELRTVPRLDKRINAVSKLGYKKCVIPKVAEKSTGVLDLGDLEVIGCRNLKEVINRVFV
ncbi:uncharacterized protein [Aristolochia californica]|uniref:uncharacterized protein isoform X2 n=1 Tax=Aristolochia californica TaxID=171875 RepID=UPI0035E25C82